MNRLIYPLVASAMITILPFLLTFEKGQNIVRGLFGYETLGLLLLFIWFKKNVGQKTDRLFFKGLWSAGTVITGIIMIFVAWLDLLNLLAMKGWSVGWYGLLPFATCGLAVAMVWRVKSCRLASVLFILFVVLVAHLGAFYFYPAQPLMQFPVVDFLDRMAPKPVNRKNLPKAFAEKYHATDSASVTRLYVDSCRSNVLILLESWGIPLNEERFENDLDVFEGIPMRVGVHHRMYSRTRTAEREDLIYEVRRDSLKRRDTTFLPQVFEARGVKTYYLFGGDSLEQMRFKYIPHLGFEKIIFGEASGDFSRKSDAEMAAQVNRLLVETLTDSLRFIAWTTLDTKFPLLESCDPYSVDVQVLDSAYRKRLQGTLGVIADLARSNPKVRFIVQGDHDPILAPLKFQELFYKRWVPYIVLN